MDNLEESKTIIVLQDNCINENWNLDVFCVFSVEQNDVTNYDVLYFEAQKLMR